MLVLSEADMTNLRDKNLKMNIMLLLLLWKQAENIELEPNISDFQVK